jgi:16S rRNA (cytosine(1402)-N(4))-methyltransferase
MTTEERKQRDRENQKKYYYSHKEEKYASHKKWRKENPEKYREQQRRHREKPEYKEYRKKWVDEHREQVAEYQRRYREKRKAEKIETTTQLADIIASCYPAAARRDGNPSRKCFQALRIAVNDELGSLERVLDTAFDMLNTDGVLSIITFHSLEDRIVKQKFKEYCTGCTCPSDFPVCVCGKKPRGELQFKKPIIASEEELAVNQRSRSAKLRAIKKL